MVSIFNIKIDDLTFEDALNRLEQLLNDQHSTPSSLYFVNTHTLNLAYDDPDFRSVLAGATHVFGDGTGVRWASRLRGVRLKANLNGTDLVPALLSRAHGYRYFMLGGCPETIERAATRARQLFPNWELAGHHHGYCQDTASVIEQINATKPHLLLVGMGNPIQENWIHDHIGQLNARLCVGVGGLFHYWSGDLQRARSWVRRIGLEWAEIMLQQPHKWKRYLIGNPLFLYRNSANYGRFLSPGAGDDLRSGMNQQAPGN